MTGLPAERFGKTTLKRHNPKTVRKNVGDSCHGRLVIRVGQGAALYRRIESWTAATMKGALVAEARRGTVGKAPVIHVARLRAHQAGRSAVG